MLHARVLSNTEELMYRNTDIFFIFFNFYVFRSQSLYFSWRCILYRRYNNGDIFIGDILTGHPCSEHCCRYLYENTIQRVYKHTKPIHFITSYKNTFKPIEVRETDRWITIPYFEPLKFFVFIIIYILYVVVHSSVISAHNS